jgi:hypothetical protein
MRRPLPISSVIAITLAIGAGAALGQAEPAAEAPEPPVATPEPTESPTETPPTTIQVGPDAPPAAPAPAEPPKPTPKPRTPSRDTAPEVVEPAPSPPDSDAGSLATPTPTPAPDVAPPPGGIEAALTCLAPADAAGLDAVLARAGSPLAGHGSDFVSQSQRVGLDPRFLVAVAAHETILMSYGPSRLISNPFGLGPGWSFAGPSEAIETAATVLSDGYLSQGLTAIPTIGAKWAPVGASNDPTDLNSAWPRGVARFYTALGGDPSAEVLLTVQGALPRCAGSGEAEPVGTPTPNPAPQATPGDGPVVVTAWNGADPQPLGPGPAGGHDPVRARPATVSGFVFPIAARVGDPIAFRDPRAASGGAGCAVAGGPCTVRIEPGAGAPVVASRTGTIVRASLPEQEAGIGFWLQPQTGIRVGYGALAAYAEGVAAGARVEAGTLLGASGEAITFALEHQGQRLNPYPLLAVTRPPSR